MVKVALAQYSGNTNKEVNVRKAETMAREAATNGAKIICFPELSTTIYFCYELNPDNFQLAESVPGPSVDRMRQVARETGTVIVYPLYEIDDGIRYNTAVLIGTDGEIVGKYRKSSIPQFRRTMNPDDPPPGDERYYFTSGNLGFPVFDTPFGVKVGILICYDRHFPEAARAIGLGGAHLLLVPTATHWKWVRDVWEIELRGHAVANNYYVGGVNKVGRDVGGLDIRHYFGSAVFIDPKGEVITRAGDQEDEILYADIDPAVSDDVRELWRFFEFRRPDAYEALIKDPVQV
jgi:N-carbamoylputrescine amidase